MESFHVFLEGRHIKNKLSPVYCLPIDIVHKIWVDYIYESASQDQLVDKVYQRLVENWKLDRHAADVIYRDVFRQRIHQGFFEIPSSQPTRRRKFFQCFVELGFELDFFKFVCDKYDLTSHDAQNMMPIAVKLGNMEYVEYLYNQRFIVFRLCYQMADIYDPKINNATNIGMFVIALSQNNIGMASWISKNAMIDEDYKLLREEVDDADIYDHDLSCDRILQTDNLNLEVSSLDFALKTGGSFSQHAFGLAARTPFVNQKEILLWLAKNNIYSKYQRVISYDLIDHACDSELMEWIRTNLPPQYTGCSPSRLSLLLAKLAELEHDAQKYKQHVEMIQWIKKHHPSLRASAIDLYIGFCSVVSDSDKIKFIKMSLAAEIVDNHSGTVSQLYRIEARRNRCDVLKIIQDELEELLDLSEVHSAMVESVCLRNFETATFIKTYLCFEKIPGLTMIMVWNLLKQRKFSSPGKVISFLETHCDLADITYTRDEFVDIFATFNMNLKSTGANVGNIKAFTWLLKKVYKKSYFSEVDRCEMRKLMYEHKQTRFICDLL